MSLRDEVERHLKLLGARSVVIAEAYAIGGGCLDEVQHPDIVDELVQRRIATRMAGEGPVRISKHLFDHLNGAMNIARIRHGGFDIAPMLEEIEKATSMYHRFRVSSYADAQRFLGNIRQAVNDLCSALQDESTEVWTLIEGEFSLVESLEAKIELNKRRLERTGKLIEALESLDIGHFIELGGGDRELRTLLAVQVPAAVESSRQNLGTALTRLSKMLFRFERLSRNAALVRGFARHLAKNPGYESLDYASHASIPPLFRAIEAVGVKAAADVHTTSDRVELDLADLLHGLRTEQHTTKPGEVSEGYFEEPQADEFELEPSPLTQAVRSMFVEALNCTSPVSVLESADLDVSTNVEMWLLVAHAEYNALPKDLRSAFSLEFVGQQDPCFDGNFNATDILICPL